MATSLPLRIRKDLRDVWRNPDAQLRTTIQSLSSDLGYPVEVHADWEVVHESLRGRLQQDALVSTVASIVNDILKSIQSKFEDGPWTEALLMWLKFNGDRRFDVTVKAEGETTELKLDREVGGLLILLPPARVPFVPQRPEVLALVESLVGSGADDEEAAEEAEDDGEWAEVPPSQQPKPVAQTQVDANAHRPTISYGPADGDKLLRAADLEPPKKLFSSRPPYLLQVDNSSSTTILVHCSHQKTLELMQEYLRRHLTVNPQSTRREPYASLELKESFIASVYDTLEIGQNQSLRQQFGFNPVLVHALVESLGYQRIPSTEAGGHVSYRRDLAFAS